MNEFAIRKMLAFFYLILGVVCADTVASSCNANKSSAALNRTDDSPAGILKLLFEGKTLLELEESDRDMVAFMGITGSGKTTFVLHIGGNDEDLTSKETRPRSGEFIIEDRCNRSSSSSRTLESHTLVPDRFIDSETTLTYFDMPGFSDTRPMVAYDIAATYFTKLVLDYAKRVKLVFVVNHSHLKVGEDRGRFTELVNHITTFIGNLTKFQDSIALIVSKVNNIHSPDAPNEIPYVSDWEIVEGVADFLQDAKSFYLENDQPKAAQLIDIFLHRKNKSLDRIGIFRRPDRSGPLTKVKLIQNSKPHSRAIINRNIRFTEKNVTDFGYTLSEKSRNMLHKLREEIMKNATLMIHTLGERIQTHFRRHEDSAADLAELTSVFKHSYVDFTPFDTVTDFVNYLDTFIQQVKMDTDADQTKLLLDIESFMKFINEISGDRATSWSSTIQNGMADTVEYLRTSQAWYIVFLNTMYDTLSGYEVQNVKARSEYDISSLLHDIDELTKNSVINLSQLDKSMTKFLEGMGNEALSALYNSLGPIYLDGPKLGLLKKILNTTLNHKVETLCSHRNEALTIKGRYVLLTQVADEFRRCPSAHFIKVLVLEKLFLDTSLNLTGKAVELFMIAPIWMTIGRIEITLNGENGRQYLTAARSGTESSMQEFRNGHHGAPGMPGGSAGHFFGMGEYFINDNQLTISAVGGIGGNGQNGGDGYPGKFFKDPRSYDGTNDDFNAHWPEYTVKKTRTYSSGFWRTIGWVLGVAPDKEVYKVEITTPPGGSGGNGGNGGRGGIGGHLGNVTLVDFSNNNNNNSSAKIITRRGDNGKNGKAGRGARGGYAGNTLIETYTKEKYWWSSTFKRLGFMDYTDPSTPVAPNGFNGLDGTNDDGIVPPTLVLRSDPKSTVREYETYTCDNLASDVRKYIWKPQCSPKVEVQNVA